MRYEKDFADFLKLLNNNKVKYCIIGAFAVGFHGYPRFTNDIDILVEPTLANAKKLIKTIREFGINSPDLNEEDFIQENKVIQLGYEPVRIDLLTSVKGLSFKDIWKNKETGTYANENAFFMGWNELIKSKKKARRQQDLIDLERLLKRRK
jgi:hypothetical protein